MRIRVKLADKPGSVVDSHSSGPPVARGLERPTREQREPRYRSPIWSCSGWGLPCRFRCRKRGGLLPVRNLGCGTALAGAPFHPCLCPCGHRRYFSVAPQEKPYGKSSPAPKDRKQLPAGRFTRGIAVAILSMASRPPAVSRHPALRSPDFPLSGNPRTAAAWPASALF